MTGGPMVSVVMSYYNRIEYLGEAIESILSQTFTDFEFIILNDGSTDESRAFVAKYTDSRIILLDNNSNMGIAASRNKMFSFAKGKYIVAMDSDDLSEPDRLERQVDFMEANQNIDICGTYCDYIHSIEVVTHPIFDEEIKIAFLKGCSIMYGSCIMRRSSLIKVNLIHDETFITAEDYELFTRYADTLIYHNIPHILYHVRRHSGRSSSLLYEKSDSLSDYIRNRELDKFIPARTAEESVNHCKIAKQDFSDITSRFSEQMDWLNKLQQKNMDSKYFTEHLFNNFILHLKSLSEKGYADRVFIFAERYNLTLLYEFLRSDLQPYKFYSLKVGIKIIIKCLLHKRLT